MKLGFLKIFAACISETETSAAVSSLNQSILHIFGRKKYFKNIFQVPKSVVFFTTTLLIHPSLYEFSSAQFHWTVSSPIYLMHPIKPRKHCSWSQLKSVQFVALQKLMISGEYTAEKWCIDCRLTILFRQTFFWLGAFVPCNNTYKINFGKKSPCLSPIRTKNIIWIVFPEEKLQGDVSSKQSQRRLLAKVQNNNNVFPLVLPLTAQYTPHPSTCTSGLLSKLSHYLVSPA